MMSIFVTIQDTVIVLCLFFWRKRSDDESHKFRLEKLACTKLQVAEEMMTLITSLPFSIARQVEILKMPPRKGTRAHDLCSKMKA